MKSRVVNMNQEERINAVFEGRKPDRLPWFADLVYWYEGMKSWGKLPPQYYDPVPLRGGVYGEGRVRLYKDLGCGAHEELEDKDTVNKITYYITPLGELRSVWKYSKYSSSTAPVEYAVKTERDLKILQYIYKDMIVEPNEEVYELQRRWMEQWKGIGIVSSLAPRAPMS
ncbi:hypothetical protein B6U74_06885, partial [Candidatus Bathyarchaeota archaeon ex4484_205]